MTLTTLRIALALALGKKRKAAGIKAGRTRRANKALRDSACGNNLTATTGNVFINGDGLWTSQETRGPNPENMAVENTAVRVPTALVPRPSGGGE